MAALEIEVFRTIREQQLESIDPYFRDFIRRLRSSVRFTDSIKQSASWIVEYTKDPRDETKPYSFAEHEYQIDICNDDTPEQVIQKCSQVGASELAVRRLAAMMGLLTGVTAIYTMPSANPAKKFTKERIDTVVANCEPLMAILNKDVDNTEQKQFGNNFLHISGTFGAVSAISVPTKILVKDEINFSNPTILGKFKSRMSHNKPGETIDISFSTPTQPEIGVSEKFELSDKKYYHVLHDACGEWVALKYQDDCVVIPGYNDVPLAEGEQARTVLDWQADDVENPDYDIDGAWYRCPCCFKEVTHQNLCDANKRKWLSTRVSAVSGRQIFPHDVPTYNPLSKILRSLGGVSGYTTKADWVNFCLGLPYNDTTTSFQTVLLDSPIGQQVEPGPECAYNTVAGLDVGKVSWFKVGKPEGKKTRVIYAEKITNSDDGAYLEERVAQLCKWFGVRCLVVDTAPDITSFRRIKARHAQGHTFGSVYVNNRSKKAVDWEVDEVEQVVNAYRTGVISNACRDFNAGHIEYAALSELQTIKDHMSAMTRVTIFNTDGEATYRWINGRKPDHYTHSLVYMMLARAISEELTPAAPAVVCLSMGKVAMKQLESSSKLMA